MDLAINVTLAGAGKASRGEYAAAIFSLAARSPEVDTADIRFSVPSAGPVSLSIYDVAGREVRQLVRGELASGDHSRIWDGRDSQGHLVGSGVYVIKLHAAHRDATQKVVLLR
jgi:flagellar hook assembly protein FlgD